MGREYFVSEQGKGGTLLMVAFQPLSLGLEVCCGHVLSSTSKAKVIEEIGLPSHPEG